MKKFLIFLLALYSLQISSSVEQTVVFDFTDPFSLNCNPTITQKEVGTNPTPGVKLQITERTITNGPVSISFNKTGSIGACVNYDGENYNFVLGLGANMKFSISGGCTFVSVKFDQPNNLRLLSLDEPGRFTDEIWKANDEKPTEVTFHNGTNYSYFYRITVTYNSPATPLNFSYSTPNDGTSVTAFNKMSLYFNTTVAKVNSGNILLTGSTLSKPLTLSAEPSGSSVLLSLDNTLSEEGNYNISVPAGIFETAEGATNTSFEVSFSIVPKRDTFNPILINPSNNSSDSKLPKTVKLTFNNYVKTGTGTVKFKSSDGETSFSANVSIDPTDKKTILLTHDYDEVKPATWTIEIPEKTFHNDFPEDDVDYRWNEKLTLTYTVDGSEYNPGPQDSEVMKAAKELLLLTGAGYPKATSAAYTALKALVEAEEAPDDAVLTTAMNALYLENDIDMPLIDNWYTMTGINSAGKKIYLTFDDAKTHVILGENANKAAAFKVKSIEGDKIVFQTKEGFFLHVLTTLPMHEGTSSSNLTDAESDINQLSIAKFAANSVEGADSKALYGTFTIFGSLGKVNGVEEKAYALIDYENNAISTYPNTPLTFNEKMSNAFILTATTEPVEVIEYTYISVGLAPGLISKPGDETVLKVSGPTATSIADASKIYYTKDGEKVDFSETILTSTDTPNNFKVNTTGLKSGTYILVIEEGALSYDVPLGKTPKETDMNSKLIIQGNGGDTPTPTPSPTEVTPTASLTPSEPITMGGALVLTIANVKKATLSDNVTPFFKYADGDNSGETVSFSSVILTMKSDTEFNVNTVGLAAGKYLLLMPKGTFAYEVEEGKVNDTDLSVSFEIKNTSPVVTDDFRYVYDAYMTFCPASDIRDVYYKDTDLNEMIIYVNTDMASGLYANVEKQVKVITTNGVLATTGHFENYPDFAKDYGDRFAGTYAIKFVPDKLVEAGDLDNWNGKYSYRCEPGTFGDANYGKWLQGDNSVKPSDCRVNPLVSVGSITIDNREATAISSISAQDVTDKVFFDIQGRRVQDTSKKGVYIINGKKVVVK